MTETSSTPRLGITIPPAGSNFNDLAHFVRTAEDLGYESVWSEESTAADGFIPLAVAASNSSRLRLVTGVVNPYTRGWAVLAQTVATLSIVSGGRFTLGLGSSSKTIVEDYNGGSLTRPVASLRAVVDYLHRALSGDRVDGGFRLQQVPESPVPIVLAALQGRALDLAAEIASGAFANFLPASAASTVRSQYPANKEFACRVFSFVGEEDEAMAAACRLFAAYGSSPFYARFFESLGYGDRLRPMAEAWAAGDRKLALDLVPVDMVREIFLLGPAGAQRERLDRLREAGIDTPVLAIYGNPELVRKQLTELAPA